MCFARETQQYDTVVSFENLHANNDGGDDVAATTAVVAAEMLNVGENENDVISISRAIQLRELLDDLARRFWCCRQKGYLYGTKMACLDCTEDLLIVDADIIGSPAYIAFERGNLQGFEQHRFTKRCLDYAFECEFCDNPLAVIRQVEECSTCLLLSEDSTNRLTEAATRSSSAIISSTAATITDDDDDVVVDASAAEGRNADDNYGGDDDVLIDEIVRYFRLTEISPIFATNMAYESNE